ncbi:capsular polysaccharide biosynthesis protein [Alkalihalobacillus sp. 1P02AB]|uniref:capsular polysaccharide export protein, LipB/KpsS family n=1 Tax=Alkalihalobacillus sp. 1P02AB TaxID=3132260 RepID=UPI0039A40E5F
MAKIKETLKGALKVIWSYWKVGCWVIEPKNKENQPIAFLFGFSNWKKSFMAHYLSNEEIKLIPSTIQMNFLSLIMKRYEKKAFYIWGCDEKRDDKIIEFAKSEKIPFFRVEDGFIRSKNLGVMKAPPLSLCIDSKGIYFDATSPSDLEEILNHYDFQADTRLIERAQAGIETIKNLGISKYNHVLPKGIEEIFGEKKRKRVLVIGQVEDDASIKKGCEISITNNELVRLAKKENPNADIIYKPHPDVLYGKRKLYSNPEEVKEIAYVMEEPIRLNDALETIDHVYTITSLAGFEALIRNIPVTTIGAPFYSGWGLTDDRQPVSRRKRKLTLEEVFAGAYLLYPKYVDVLSGETITMETAMKQISIEMMEERKG